MATPHPTPTDPGTAVDAGDRAQRTSDKYGAHTIELLAVKPTGETSR